MPRSKWNGTLSALLGCRSNVHRAEVDGEALRCALADDGVRGEVIAAQPVQDVTGEMGVIR
jgi:hypothetical protein